MSITVRSSRQRVGVIEKSSVFSPPPMDLTVYVLDGWNSLWQVLSERCRTCSHYSRNSEKGINIKGLRIWASPPPRWYLAEINLSKIIHSVNMYQMLRMEAKLGYRYRDEDDTITTLERPIIHSITMGDNSSKSLSFGYSEISWSFWA